MMRYRTLPGTELHVCAALARERGLTLLQLALAYVRWRWYMGAFLVGATSVEQLAEDLAAARCELDGDTLEAIARIQQHYPNPAP